MSEIDVMASLVEKWVNINSHSNNMRGIDNLIEEIKTAFQILEPDEMHVIPFASSKGLFLKKKGAAPLQIFFGGHLDTVFPIDHPFQKAVYLDENTLQGPGVTDMKGGIVVLLKALEAFEKKEYAHKIGWEIFLNADEEIGSPESTPFIERCAENCDLALLFEPTLENGFFISKRKGSGTYHITSRGKKAHVGRNPLEGKNAIYPLAHFIVQIHQIGASYPELLMNVGLLKGGLAANIIPDFAECYLNMRSDQLESIQEIEQLLQHYAKINGITCERITFRPPKLFNQKTEKLFQALKTCGEQLGIEIQWRESGGVCDGNTLAAKGVATIDTLGVQGGNIHTENEYLHLPSLYEKKRLVEEFLREIALEKITLN